MQRREATWADIEVGSYIVANDGGLRRVVGLDRDWTNTITTISGKGAEPKTFALKPDDTPVTMAVPTIEEAVNTVARVLGGTIIEEQQQ